MVNKYVLVKKGTKARVAGRDKKGNVNELDVKFGKTKGVRVKVTKLGVAKTKVQNVVKRLTGKKVPKFKHAEKFKRKPPRKKR